MKGTGRAWKRRIVSAALALGLGMLLVGPGCVVVIPTGDCIPEIDIQKRLVVPQKPVPPAILVPLCVTPTPVPVCPQIVPPPTCPTAAAAMPAPMIVTATPAAKIVTVVTAVPSPPPPTATCPPTKPPVVITVVPTKVPATAPPCTPVPPCPTDR